MPILAIYRYKQDMYTWNTLLAQMHTQTLRASIEKIGFYLPQKATCYFSKKELITCIHTRLICIHFNRRRIIHTLLAKINSQAVKNSFLF